MRVEIGFPTSHCGFKDENLNSGDISRRLSRLYYHYKFLRNKQRHVSKLSLFDDFDEFLFGLIYVHDF